MPYKQIVQPRTWVQDGAGWCLRFVQAVFATIAMYENAWVAWLNQRGRHFKNMPTNVSVAVWFSHWGTYNGIYKNWGHVVAWVPGRGYLSSPGAGYGQAWFPTIGAVEAYFGASYVGWTTYVHNRQIVKWVANLVKPKPKPKPVQSWRDEEDEMNPKVIVRTQGNMEVTLASPDLGKDLRGSESRTSGNLVRVFRGFMVSTSPVVHRAWARLYAGGVGNEHARVNRDDYMAIQSEARRVAEQSAVDKK